MRARGGTHITMSRAYVRAHASKVIRGCWFRSFSPILCLFLLKQNRLTMASIHVRAGACSRVLTRPPSLYTNCTENTSSSPHITTRGPVCATGTNSLGKKINPSLRVSYPVLFSLFFFFYTFLVCLVTLCRHNTDVEHPLRFHSQLYNVTTVIVTQYVYIYNYVYVYVYFMYSDLLSSRYASMLCMHAATLPLRSSFKYV